MRKLVSLREIEMRMFFICYSALAIAMTCVREAKVEHAAFGRLCAALLFKSGTAVDANVQVFLLLSLAHILTLLSFFIR